MKVSGLRNMYLRTSLRSTMAAGMDRTEEMKATWNETRI
jgi:hypothetical protein